MRGHSKMADFKIMTTHVKPPVPSRSWDYCAYFDGEEENGPVGWGRDIAEAIEDLQMSVDLWEFPEPEIRARIEALKAFYAKATP